MKLLAAYPIDGSPTQGLIDFDKIKASAFPTNSLPAQTNLTIGLILSQALTYVYIIAGLLLLFLLISGGFQLMLGATDPKAKEAAGKRITNALLGFFILFISYWLVQIVEVIFGISILK